MQLNKVSDFFSLMHLFSVLVLCLSGFAYSGVAEMTVYRDVGTAGEQHKQSDHVVNVSDGWVRATVPGSQVNAGYLTMHNISGRQLKIARIDAENFGLVEIHNMVAIDGMIRMRRVKELIIPVNGKVELKPGGKHLMLMRREKPVEAGKVINIAIYFESGESQLLSVPIKK